MNYIIYQPINEYYNKYEHRFDKSFAKQNIIYSLIIRSFHDMKANPISLPLIKWNPIRVEMQLKYF